MNHTHISCASCGPPIPLCLTSTQVHNFSPGSEVAGSLYIASLSSAPPPGYWLPSHPHSPQNRFPGLHRGHCIGSAGKGKKQDRKRKGTEWEDLRVQD